MRPMPQSSRGRRCAFLVALVAAAIGFAAACSNPDTQDNCTGDGCSKFAACNGTIDSCCAGLKDNDLAECRYGYGDPTCSYLSSVTNGTNVAYTCATAPPDGGGTGGGGTGGGDAGDGG